MTERRAALKRAVVACMAGTALLFPAAPALAATFPGIPYCSVPPVAGMGVKPNLLLMLDNSASMYDLAYTDPAAFCVDDGYDNAKSYPGYFDQKRNYNYNQVSGRFESTTEPLPAGCNTADTPFLCIDMDDKNKVERFIGSGKFLNWLTMSKLDLEKQVLTGGKFIPDDPDRSPGTMIPETRGCMGSRFVKVVSGAPDVTFGVRGPSTADDDYRYGIYSGETRIEIYKRKYNKEKCLVAVGDWLNGTTAATLRTDTSACVGSDYLYEADGTTPSKGKTYIDVLINCYATPDNVTGDGVIKNDCRIRAEKVYGNALDDIPKGVGDDICSSMVPHGLSRSKNGMETFGYLGSCGGVGTADPDCYEPQAEQYCREMASRLLTDPTTGNTPRSNVNVPGFILEAGLYSLGHASGVLNARVAVPSAPTGVIHEYASDINFAAMVFNDNGANASECKKEDVYANNGGFVYGDVPCAKRCTGPGWDEGAICHTDNDCGNTCAELAPSDGGRVASAMNAPLGDANHSTGLIAAIDGIAANSWTPLGEAFYNAIGYFSGRTDLRLQEGDFDPAGFPSPYACQRNNVLMVTDGASTTDRNGSVLTLVANAVRDWGADTRRPMPQSLTTKAGDAFPPFGGSYNIDDLAWVARNRNIADFSREAVDNRDYISTYVVFTGPPCGDYNADGTCKTADEEIPEKIMQLTAAKGGGRIANARSPADLEEAFRKVLQQISSGSGTDAAVVSTGDGNGALFLMEQYFPSRSFDGGLSSASWIGEMQGLWYYIDPFLGKADGSASSIREDSDENNLLDIGSDKVVRFRSEAGSNRTYAYRLEGGTEIKTEIDDLKPLWRAGRLLWSRDLVKNPRTVYAPLLNGGAEVGSSGLMRLSSASPDAVTPFLNLTGADPDAAKLLKFVEGFDFPGDSGMRSRTLVIGGSPASAAAPRDTGVGVWKLGDIVSSTPQVQSQSALGAYHLPPPRGYADASYASFVGSAAYKGRGMIYLGANDGMLHAFKLGSLDTTPSDSIQGDVKAQLTGSGIGGEEWAFVPKHVLPYLKHLADPRYRHLYLVDGKLSLVDASIGVAASACSRATYWTCKKSSSTWRTVLIGSMGLGGASCAAADDAAATASQCVRAPAPDPGSSGDRIGYSSYFALDVTDPAHPALLWEFSDTALGYSTAGPAIVRIGDRDKNGRWFAVIGSGPTGPIDAQQHRFLGRSGQELKLFVVDLLTGELLATKETGVKLGFAGAMSGGAIDADKWDGSYQDDAIYIGYTKGDSDTVTPSTQWNSGGVLRVFTKENQNPAQWTVGTLIDGIGPVTTGIARLQDRGNHNLWLYFGTGRYFFPRDDMELRRALYGVKEPCYNVKSDGVIVKPDRMDASCTASVRAGSLSDQTAEHTFAGSDPGWFIDMEPPGGGYGAERLIGTPTSVTGGAVFFATSRPATDPCRLGASYLWEVKYDTGGSVGNGMLGKVLMQAPAGSVEETTLSRTGARKGGALPGSGKALPVTNSGLKPVRRIIHIQER